MTSINAAAPSQNVYASALVTGVALTPGSIMTLLRRRMQDMDGQVDSIMSEIDVNTARSENLQRQVEGLNAVRAAMANAQSDANRHVELGDIDVTFEGHQTTADALLRDLGIALPTNNVNSSRSVEQLEGLKGAIERDIQEEQDAMGMGDLDLNDPDAIALIYGNPKLRELRKRLHDVNVRINAGGGPVGTDRITGASMDNFLESVKSQARRANSGNEVLMVRLQSVMQQRSQTVTMATQMMKSITDSEKSIAQNIGR